MVKVYHAHKTFKSLDLGRPGEILDAFDFGRESLYVESRRINDKVLPIEKRRAASSNPSIAQCQKFKK